MLSAKVATISELSTKYFRFQRFINIERKNKQKKLTHQTKCGIKCSGNRENLYLCEVMNTRYRIYPPEQLRATISPPPSKSIAARLMTIRALAGMPPIRIDNPCDDLRVLANGLTTADTTINANTRGAALRFGHDTIILPLACLMGIHSIAYNTADLDNLHLHWQDYRIIPMAANMQMIFYRPTTGTGDILVKVLYNEHEATLPVHTDNPPYYRWSELRQFYLNKLDTPINLNP